MDEFAQGLLVCVLGLLVFFGSLFVFLQAQHRWDVGRDMYLMAHCKVVVQTVGAQSTKEFNCKEQ